jgi:hypothetical protein
MANYKKIRDDEIPISNVVLNEMTQFIAFAKDIANAAWASNIAALKSRRRSFQEDCHAARCHGLLRLVVEHDLPTGLRRHFPHL